MILVTGATGTVGRNVADQLLAAGQPVRALVRTPERARLPRGVEVVAGDLDRPDSLLAAFRGVERIFLLAAAGPEGPVQDRRATTAARAAGGSQVVKLSALGADTASEDPIARWHLAGERAVAESGLAYTFLRPNGFMSNTLRWAGSIAADGTVSVPFARAPSAVIDPVDIAAVAVAVLSDTPERHRGQGYPLTGPEALRAADQVAILADVLGRRIEVIDVSPEAARARMVTAGMAPEVADALLARARAGTPYDPPVHPTVERLTGRPARSYRRWVADHLDSFR